MPFFKNLKDEVCQVLEPEVALVVKSGWKQLNEAEEAAYRETLKAAHELTSAASIEAARVKAGIYSLMSEPAVAEAEKAASKKAAATSDEQAAPTDSKVASDKVAGDAAK